MSSMLSALLGLGIGLCMCVAGVCAWRVRRTHKRRLQHTFALRQAMDLERIKAEAAQRAATLVQQELTLSELATRREALSRRIDVAPFEPPPLSKSTNERMPGDRVEWTGRVPAWTLLLAPPPAAGGSGVGGASNESSQELSAPEADFMRDAITELKVDASLSGLAIDAHSPSLPIAQGLDDASTTPGSPILAVAAMADLASLPGEAVYPVPPTDSENDGVEERPNRHLLLGAPVVKDRSPSIEPTGIDMPSEFEPAVGIEASSGVPGAAAIGLQALQEAGASLAPADPLRSTRPDEEPLLVAFQALGDAKQIDTDRVGLELEGNEPMAAVQAPQRPAEEAAVDGPSGEELFAATRDDLSQPLEIPFVDTETPSPHLLPSRRFRPTTRDPSRIKATRLQAIPATPRERPLSIDLRLHMHRGGRCGLSLLGRRHQELPGQVTVVASGGNLDLTAMQEGWFEGVHSNDLGTTLQTGVQWAYQAGADSFRWLLSGRPIYVLSPHPELSGFVNTTRLELGQRHVVLCTQEWAAKVRVALAACGAQPTGESGIAHGLPSPWIAIHGVTPTKSVQTSSEASYLDCLCPHSDAEIYLTGGIKLEANTWLAAFPPRIRLLGDPTTFGQLFIDQKPAQQDEDGSFFVPGWGATGRHTIAWATGTRSYVIQEPPCSWTPWAHSSSETPLSHGEDGGRSVCGALVTRYQTSAADKRAVLVPSTNTFLIGALPGQIWACEEAPHLPASAPRVGFPPFDPIWAMPRQVLRCDKRQASVMLLPEVAREAAVAPSTSLRRGSRIRLKPEVRAWCAAILDASRKGLAVSPSDPAAVALWNGYRLVARQMTRSAR